MSTLLHETTLFFFLAIVFLVIALVIGAFFFSLSITNIRRIARKGQPEANRMPRIPKAAFDEEENRTSRVSKAVRDEEDV